MHGGEQILSRLKRRGKVWTGPRRRYLSDARGISTQGKTRRSRRSCCRLPLIFADDAGDRDLFVAQSAGGQPPGGFNGSNRGPDCPGGARKNRTDGLVRDGEPQVHHVTLTSSREDDQQQQQQEEEEGMMAGGMLHHRTDQSLLTGFS